MSGEGKGGIYMYVRISMCIVVCVCCVLCVRTCVCIFVSVHDGIDNCVHLLCWSPKGHIIFLWSQIMGRGDKERREGRRREPGGKE